MHHTEYQEGVVLVMKYSHVDDIIYRKTLCYKSETVMLSTKALYNVVCTIRNKYNLNMINI